MAEFESRHSETVDSLEEVLLRSLRKRVTKQPNLCKDCVEKKNDSGDCGHAKIGILVRFVSALNLCPKTPNHKAK